jgi:hypothetical protein
MLNKLAVTINSGASQQLISQSNKGYIWWKSLVLTVGTGRPFF